MNITIVGASRGTGSAAVIAAISAGHQVVALSRSGSVPAQSPSDRVTAMAGDARDPAVVRRAVAGSDAVLVTLGMPARDRSGLRAEGTGAVIAAMRAEGVRRLVVQSSLGVRDSAPQLPWFMARVIVPFVLRHAFVDHTAQEEAVEASGLDWTLIRPGHLKRRRSTSVDVGVEQLTKRHTVAVSREQLADVLVASLADSATVGRALAVSGVR